MNVGTHKKQVLALHCTLSKHCVFKQASDYDYFWKDSKRIHAVLKILNNQSEMIKLAKVKVNCVNRRRLSDDKNNFITANVVSIADGIPTRSIGNHMKHFDVPKSTKYRSFIRGNVKRKIIIDAVDDINLSSEKNRIKQYPKVNYELIIQI